jgi:Peptidase family M28
MALIRRRMLTAVLIVISIAFTAAQQQTQTPPPQPPAQPQGGGTGTAPVTLPDDVRTLVTRLELEKYKATIKGLTQFGDRREGTERNRKAVDWIEAQLKSYGCETARISYDPAAPIPRAEGRGRQGQGTGRGRGRGRGTEPARTPAGTPDDPVRRGAGGKGYGGRTGVNNDPMRQPDEALRALNQGPVIPGIVDEVYCTKWGATRPGEMYILGAHMDGIGYGAAANDDGSGTAIVMELARIFSAPDVVTDVSIRFALWNGEEGGLRGANWYVQQRRDLQGKEDPPGSGKYPEPKWLGMIQHDMMMFDHGMPRPDGTLAPEQRPEADVNIEFQENSKMAAESHKLALALKNANERYATDYPATVGSHMQSTDSVPFQDIIAAVSLRENERRDHIGFGWDPHWHQPTDVYSTFSDKDFKLGLNAAQTTLAAMAQLTGAKIKP